MISRSALTHAATWVLRKQRRFRRLHEHAYGIIQFIVRQTSPPLNSIGPRCALDVFERLVTRATSKTPIILYSPFLPKKSRNRGRKRDSPAVGTQKTVQKTTPMTRTPLHIYISIVVALHEHIGVATLCTLEAGAYITAGRTRVRTPRSRRTSHLGNRKSCNRQQQETRHNRPRENRGAGMESFLEKEGQARGNARDALGAKKCHVRYAPPRAQRQERGHAEMLSQKKKNHTASQFGPLISILDLVTPSLPTTQAKNNKPYPPPRYRQS